MNKLKVMSNSQVTPNLLRSIASLYCREKCHILIKGVSKKNVNILYAYEQPWTVLGQNGTDKMVWTKWYTDKMILDKMVWT